MVSRGKVELNVKQFSEGSEEIRSECEATVGNDVGGYTMFGKDMKIEKFCDSVGSYVGSRRDKMRHFGETVYHNKNGIETLRGRKAVNGIHRYRRPRTLGNREWFKKSVRVMSFGFGSVARVARSDVSLDEILHLGPIKVPLDKFQGLSLTEMAGNRMIVMIAENA